MHFVPHNLEMDPKMEEYYTEGMFVGFFFGPGINWIAFSEGPRDPLIQQSGPIDIL